MIVGICMVRDEADIIREVIERMLIQVDHLLILDNGSTDGTREILASFDKVNVVDDPKVGHRYREVVTRLARAAAQGGATWCLPFDGDEIWIGPIRKHLHSSPNSVLNVPIFDHVITPTDNPMESVIRRMKWRRSSSLCRVAFRPTPDCFVADGGHTVRYGDGPWTCGDRIDGVSVRHFPVRSYEQFEKKAAKAVEALKDPTRDPGDSTHWARMARELHRGKLREMFDREYVSLTPKASGLVWDPVL